MMKRILSKRENKIHKALIAIAQEDVELLSYKGQTLWNKLSLKTEKKMKKVI